jgi:hypothetical protein
MSRKASQKSNPLIRFKFVLIALAAALGLSLFGAEPQFVEARPLTCPVYASSTLPTKTQFHDLVVERGSIDAWYVYAPVSTRCQLQLGKGHYLYRAQWNVRLQLSKGWPIGVDYTENPLYSYDASMMTFSAAWFDIPPSGLTYFEEQDSGLGYPYMQPYSSAGDWQSKLTDLCVGERCTFTNESTGMFSNVSDLAVPFIITQITMCMTFVPRGPEGEAETEACGGNIDSGLAYYAHPGVFGMPVTISGTMTFEPLWTWRR